MITYVVGDLFQSPAKVLVNAVNTVGVMGKGIALEFKQIYPEMFAQYQQFCERGQFTVGQLWLYKTSHKWVLNFPTKEDWRQKSRLEYIEQGLAKFTQTYDEKGITSVSFPLLGCGNGELNWEREVRPVMERYLDPLPINIYIHLFKQDDQFTPEHRDVEAIRKWLRGEPETLAFAEFWDDLAGLVSRKRAFQTLDTGIAFSVRVYSDGDGAGIIIGAADKRDIIIPETTLVELWQYIRAAGFAIPKNFPGIAENHSQFIISLFANLDYLKPVRLSSKSFAGHETGLQLMPLLNNDNSVTQQPAQTVEKLTG